VEGDGSYSRKQFLTMAFMFESRFAVRLTRHVVEPSELQNDYFEGWQGPEKHFKA
jgi:homogentisate 1,2-dioxygenase